MPCLVLAPNHGTLRSSSRVSQRGTKSKQGLPPKTAHKSQAEALSGPRQDRGALPGNLTNADHAQTTREKNHNLPPPCKLPFKKVIAWDPGPLSPEDHHLPA